MLESGGLMLSRKAINRQESIITHLSEAKESSVLEMTQRFKVSEATIRRDLTELEELGKLTRTFGGARFIESSGSEPPIFSRMGADTPEKERIGKAAAALVKDGDIVFISSGTTAFQAARHLSDHKNLTVLTNSLPVIDLLSRNNEVMLIVLGGVLRHKEQSLIGPATENMLSDYRADKAILGVRAIHSEHGLTNDALQETQVDRRLFEIAQEVIVVADHSKYGNIAPHFLASLTSVNYIVSDSMPVTDREVLEAEGINIVIAQD